MTQGLLDTSIVVDLLRRHPPAEAWLSEQDQLGVTRIVYLEVLSGMKGKTEQLRALTMLKHFELVEFIQDDLEWATQQLIRFGLSHNVGMMDCLIAAASYRLQLPLYTRNQERFALLLGILAQQSY